MKTPEFKFCRGCSTLKPVSEWNRKYARLQNVCRSCESNRKSPGCAARKKRKEVLAGEGKRSCSKCKVEKPFGEFHKGPGKDGLKTCCKKCRSLEGHERYKQSPAALEFAEKEQRKNDAAKKGLKICPSCEEIKPVEAFWKNCTVCKLCQQESLRIRKQKNPLVIVDGMRKCKYGIMPEDFAQLQLNQQNKCKICAEEFKGTPHVDHCHATERIRGLLCQQCNVGLGHFKDSPERLRAAANYLDKANPLK